jgi:hypothetical protein
VSFAASPTTAAACTLASGFAGLPPNSPLAADVFALRFEVLLPRNAASFFVNFTP